MIQAPPLQKKASSQALITYPVPLIAPAITCGTAVVVVVVVAMVVDVR